MMSLQVHQSSIVRQYDTQTDQEERYDANNSITSPNEITLDTIGTLDEDEGYEFQEGGIRGWATVIGASSEIERYRNGVILSCRCRYSNAFGVFQDYYTRVYIKNE